MSMILEAFMPCLGEVEPCVDISEVGVPPGCCPGIDSGRIITKGATLQVDFTINYSGTLFSILSNTERWECVVLLEDIGTAGVAGNLNFKADDNPSHIPALSGTVTGQVSIPWSPALAGKVVKPVFKVTLHVGTASTLLVCAFSEGRMIHFNEA